MRISDWSSDVCSSDLAGATHFLISPFGAVELGNAIRFTERYARRLGSTSRRTRDFDTRAAEAPAGWRMATDRKSTRLNSRSLMRISYAVFCLKKKNPHIIQH